MSLQRKRRGAPSTVSGFSLIEVLISMAITLIVLAAVFQTSRAILSIYRHESRAVEVTSMAARALDDIAMEIARAGYGLGYGVPCVLAARPGNASSESEIALRSNPSGIATRFVTDLNADAVGRPMEDGLQKDDVVLLTDLCGISERAVVVTAERDSMAFAPLGDGELGHLLSSRCAARALKLREVYYSLESSPDGIGNFLVKEVLGSGENRRVLARQVEYLRFKYLDAHGNEISLATIEDSARLAVVKITLRYCFGPAPMDTRELTTSVALDTQSASVHFAEPGYGFRLARYFRPIETPAGVAVRPFKDWGVILSAGREPSRDRSYLYTFLLQKRFREARVENVTWLEDVRDPVALCFGPERSPLAGSIFIASFGLNIGHLSRVYPDSFGVMSPESRVETFDGTRVLARIGGLAFGIDNALYIAGAENKSIFRYRFDGEGKAVGPERVATLSSEIHTMVQGADGALYFILERTDSSSLWKIPFDEKLSPREPVEVTPLPGRAISMALEPVSGNLFALVRERLGDDVILELSRNWLRHPVGELTPAFSLEQFREETQEGVLPRTSSKRRATMVLTERLPSTLVPDRLDFIAFDDFGFLYVGAIDRDIVLKFDLDRLDARHAIGIDAVVEEVVVSPKVRLRAWKKDAFSN